MGNLNNDSLEAILDRAETNPILHTIRVWGIKKLIDILKKTELHNRLPREYIKDIICNACYKLMSDEKIVEFLNELSQESDFKQKVAYARLYYLDEREMVEAING